MSKIEIVPMTPDKVEIFTLVITVNLPLISMCDVKLWSDAKNDGGNGDQRQNVMAAAHYKQINKVL